MISDFVIKSITAGWNFLGHYFLVQCPTSKLRIISTTVLTLQLGPGIPGRGTFNRQLGISCRKWTVTYLSGHSQLQGWLRPSWFPWIARQREVHKRKETHCYEQHPGLQKPKKYLTANQVPAGHNIATCQSQNLSPSLELFSRGFGHCNKNNYSRDTFAGSLLAGAYNMPASQNLQ